VDDSTGAVAMGDMARMNDQATYRDGAYMVTLHVGAYGGHAVTKSTSVIVDNFRPFVSTVTIGDHIRILKTWAFDGSLYHASITSEALTIGTFPVRIEFSEPVKDVEVRIDNSSHL